MRCPRRDLNDLEKIVKANLAAVYHLKIAAVCCPADLANSPAARTNDSGN